MQMLRSARRVIDLEIAALQAMRRRLGPSLARSVGLMRAALDQNGKIVVTGVGKSGHIGDKIAATLSSTGAPAVTLNSLNAVHGDMGIVRPGDCVLALSYSGETAELLRILPFLKRTGVSMIAITGKSRSTLADNADVVLDVAVKREACPLNLSPTSSTTAMLVMGDVLAMVLLESRGVDKDDFARFHPGGQIGKQLLLSVKEVMRPAAQVAVLKESATVEAALKEMTAKRCGATIVTASSGKLAGIFTHGDFVRHFQKSGAIGKTRLASVMTPRPVSVRVDKLAVEVLNLFERHRIEDLIVVDAQGRPAGLVDIQDIARLKVL